ncbi:hypothetical protein TAL182_CH03035 [Rhizobium sp. TAL182]|uniref:hypothetical protein n=1 Tax=Rhizobium sp. TAL182 TaxID=2020313 RepID=UPI000A210803|nr:hypothetical protein [Rhizobium sp. TAL182]ARO24780.1 hypothetical protein TAL182_CH03035 [Rhizobium sp. TAL182]
MTWSFNIDEAPRGKTVMVVRTVKGEEKSFDEKVIAPVWLATQCGRVIKSYWLEQTKFSPARWAGLAVNEVPVAWQDFIVPEHPNSPGSASTGAVTGWVDPPSTQTGSSDLQDATLAETNGGTRVAAGETATHFTLDDVGSGA